MDPNAALDNLRRAMADEDTAEMSPEVYDAFTALDNWITKGGFLPSDWQQESPMIVVGQFPATELMHALKAAEKRGGIRKMRVKIEGDKVKFKVNEGIWSPPYGEIQEPY
jgi:hypothetical protein